MYASRLHILSAARFRLLALAFCVLALAGCLAPVAVTPPLPAQSVRFGHVFVVVEENANFSDVVANPAMPYLNGLANQNGLAANYFANAHPSIPNYDEVAGRGCHGTSHVGVFQHAVERGLRLVSVIARSPRPEREQYSHRNNASLAQPVCLNLVGSLGDCGRRGWYYPSRSHGKHDPKNDVGENACSGTQYGQEPQDPHNRGIKIKIVSQAGTHACNLLIGA
jgi:hypothetical protein